jgi:hypothetical protein
VFELSGGENNEKSGDAEYDAGFLRRISGACWAICRASAWERLACGRSSSDGIVNVNVGINEIGRHLTAIALIMPKQAA